MISDQIKNQILEANNISDVIREFQDLKKAGSNFKGLCPWHNEKTPSFMVSDQKQIAKCFGCGKSGDAIEYLQSTQMMSFPEALEYLADRANITIPKKYQDDEYQKLKDLDTVFEKLVLNSNQGLLYLKTRGFSEDTINEFGIGYIPGGYKKKLNDLFYSNDLLVKAGLVNSKHNELFYNRVMFPIRNVRGKIVGWSGRTIANATPKYINTPETTLFKKREILYNFSRAKQYIKSEGFVIVVEGFTDVMRLWEKGIKNVVATCGTAFTKEHAKQIKHFTSNITFIGDGDKAGREAMKKGTMVAYDWKMNVSWFIIPEEGEDPDTYFNKDKSSSHFLRLIEKMGKDAMHFLLNYKENDSMAKVKAFQDLCKYIDQIEDLNIKHGLVEDLCKAHKLDFNTCKSYLNKSKVKKVDEQGKVLNLTDELVKEINNHKEVDIYEDKTLLFNALIQDKKYSIGFSEDIKDYKLINRSVKIRIRFDCDTDIVNGNPLDFYQLIKLAIDFLKRGHKVSVYDDKFISDAESACFRSLPDFIALGLNDFYSENQERHEELFDLSVDFILSLNEKRRSYYIDKFVNALQVKKTVFNARVKLHSKEIKDEKDRKSYLQQGDVFYEFDGKDIPDYADVQFVNHYGFYPMQSHETGKNVCYMFRNQNNNFQRIGNFFIEPLFHVEDERGGEYNKRILRIRIMTKGEPERIMEIPSGLMIDLKFFQKKLMEMGGAVFTGAQKHHWDYIIESTEQKYKRVREILTFGWQEHQRFFAFSNGALYNGEFLETDELGLVEINGRNFYSPASSSIYKGLPMESDKYQGIRFLHYDEYSEVDNLSWEEWSDTFAQVYRDNNNALFAWLYIFIANNRKFIFNNRGHFTAPFFIGQTGSGKSQIAESIKHVFFRYQSPSFNLNQGTDAAFFSLLENYCDAPVIMEEYNDLQISDNKFQGLKSAILDGIGKAKRKSASTNEIDYSRIEAPIVMLGQETPSRDDGALANRSILVEVFKKTATERTQKEVEIFERLKESEKKGLSHILKKVVDAKSYIEQQFSKVINELSKLIKDEMQKANLSFDKRIFDNYMIFLSMAKIIDGNDAIYMPFNFEDVKKAIISSICEQSNVINDNNRLSNFFNHIALGQQNKLYTFGKEFKVAKKTKVTIQQSQGPSKTVSFENPTEIFYVKIKDVYPGYFNQYKKEALNMTNLNSYLKNHKAYIGNVKSERFKWVEETTIETGEDSFSKTFIQNSKNSSCMAFYHHLLDESFILNEHDESSSVPEPNKLYKQETKVENTLEPHLFGNPENKNDDLPF